jgi:AcrR family transcriptional regulator
MTVEATQGTRRERMISDIIDHATRLFAENGYAATTLQDIADSMGLSRPTLYRYIRNKEELLTQLVADFSQESARALATIAKRSDLDEVGRLKAAIADLTARHAEHPLRFRVLVLNEAQLPETVAPAARRARRAVLDRLLAIFEDAVGTGAVRAVDAHVAVFFLLGAVNWVGWWYTPGGRLDPATLADSIVDLALNGLLNQSGARSLSDILGSIVGDATLAQQLIKAERAPTSTRRSRAERR